MQNVRLGCVYTHLGNSVVDPAFVDAQFASFLSLLRALDKVGLTPLCTLAASSAAVSTRLDTLLTGVDTGRLLHGMYHPLDPPVSMELLPVASAVKSTVIQTRWVDQGTRFGGYGRLRTDRRTLVGTLPFGWFDGLPMSSALNARVLVRGCRCPIMEVHVEACLVDLTATRGADPGDEAVFFGKQGSEALSHLDQASWAGLSELELVVQLARALPRVYLQGGRIVEIDEVHRK
jgi:alanine racemase